jgi:hypothetical protein
VEAGAAGVEALDREQVPGTAQALHLLEIHDSVPLRLAKGEDSARMPVLGRRQYRDIDLYLCAVGWISDHAGAHLTGRTAEYPGIGPDRVVATERFEVRPDHLGEESPLGTGPQQRPVPYQSIMSRDWARLELRWSGSDAPPDTGRQSRPSPRR